MQELKDKKVLVMGLGRFGGGIGVSRWLCEQGAVVTVTDLADEKALHGSMRQLEDLPITYHLDGHLEADFTEADLVIANPAVDRRQNKFLQAAIQAGVPITTEIELFLARVNAEQVVGITGSAGKSTTTAMIGHVLQSLRGEKNVHIGGNIGLSLLGQLALIEPDHLIVLELSSFMLEPMTDWAPSLGIVTNCTPNHLDRHGDFETYVKAKQRMIIDQKVSDHLILTEGVSHWAQVSQASAEIISEPAGVDLLVPGEHNQMNAALAIAACEKLGHDRREIVEALQGFAGLPHRLQLCFEHNGVTFYNDSKSTTPEAAVLAASSFPAGKVHLIAGGYDKSSDLDPIAKVAMSRCKALYTIGQTGPAIAQAVYDIDEAYTVKECGTLEEAMKAIMRVVDRGEVVLLSPGCASWDQFENYEARGRLFAEIALRLNTETPIDRD